MPTLPDLVTAPYVSAYLADLNLTGNQQAAIPSLITSASASVRAFCGRAFSPVQFDELYTVDAPDSSISLRQYPIISVDRVATDPTSILSILNTDPNATRATASLATSGDSITGYTVTGLTLSRWSSGSRIDTPVAFTGGMTAAGLAAAIVAAGGYWTATPTKGLELWPVADIRPPQGPYPCFTAGSSGGAPTSSSFFVHRTDLWTGLDERLGAVILNGNPSGSVDSPRWGPAWTGEVNDVQAYGGRLGVRVVYTAGFATIPPDVQMHVAEAVKANLERFRTDATLKSESDGVLSWSAGELLPLPRSVVLGLYPHILLRA